MPIELTCAVCGTPFKVPPARIRSAEKKGTYPKYCKKACANIGQAQNRIPWSKGLTKETDERVRQRGDAVHKAHQEHPELYSGDNHWTKKHPMTEERLAHMAYMRECKPDHATPKQLPGLEAGRAYFRGRTKENDASVARRAKILSELYKGKENPQHSEWAKKYYEEYPEKHPHFILATKGYKTSIERIMHHALKSQEIEFEAEYPVGRYFIDFAIPSHHLAIEVDGEYWHDKERDARRDAILNAKGWRVLRFSEYRVKKEIHACISEICELLTLEQSRFYPKQLQMDL